LPEALSMARGLELDLVEIAPMASPPVCKILDFGKYRYELAQKDKESRRKAQTIAIKEMKYRPKIGGGDFDTKTRKVGEFLSEGHKVKVTIMFRGREVAHPELGKAILDRIAVNLHAVAKVEAMPKLDGKNMIMVLAPDKKKVEKDETGAPTVPAAVGPTAVPSAPLAPAVAPAQAPAAPAPPKRAAAPAPEPAATAPASAPAVATDSAPA
jgi:translation initiation factor IF-3